MIYFYEETVHESYRQNKGEGKMTEAIKDIRIIPEEICCGCGACENVCPVDAVLLKEGAEGFLFPSVQEDLCIQCGKCTAACPVLEASVPNEKQPECRAAFGADELRKNSSSGAVFSVLAEYVFKKGGVVYGAVLDEAFQVIHQRAVSQIELEGIRRSKYVQSRVGLIYRQVRKDLEVGRWVLFSGTPCQNAALRKFLRKPEPKLILADLVCHGVPSQKIFDSYLKEKFPSKNLKEFYFRVKESGQNCMVSKAVLKNGKVLKNTADSDFFEKGYHQSLFLRRSCGNCRFAEPPRQGDFTIGDFWGLAKYDKSYTDRLGVSLVLLNNEKAEQIWKEISPKLKFDKPVPVEFALKNNRFRAKIKIHPGRESFFEMWKKEPFSLAVEAALEGRSAMEVRERRKRGRLKRFLKRAAKALLGR